MFLKTLNDNRVFQNKRGNDNNKKNTNINT